jgi:hypothetical protein
MKLDTRWLEWSPELTAGTGSQTKRTFDTSDTSSSSRIENIFLLEADSAAYEETLHAWALARCVFRDGTWGGIKALHKDYATWCSEAARDVPAGLATYERLLRDFCSFTTKDGLVYGVLLQEDWERRR